MPTLVHFIGTEKLVRLEDGYQKVNSRLQENGAGQFTLSSGRLATIYRSGIAYIEETSEPSVASV